MHLLEYLAFDLAFNDLLSRHLILIGVGTGAHFIVHFRLPVIISLVVGVAPGLLIAS